MAFIGGGKVIYKMQTKRAGKYLGDWLEDILLKKLFTFKVRRTIDHITKLQSRFEKKHVRMKQKFNVMSLYWDKLLREAREYILRGDGNMLDSIQGFKLGNIPEAYKLKVIHKYIYDQE